MVFMCGISGWLTNLSQKDSQIRIDKIESQISRLLDLQHHRGPDGRGLWTDQSKQVVLGHNRLSIIDLSENASQPMLCSDQEWAISYNGELYNYKKIRKNLEDQHAIRFQGSSDTEVFLQGIKVWGIDEFLRQADGMFAAAVFHRTSQRLFLIRDRVGEKPLYYCETNGGLYFASELSSLVKALDAHPALDQTALGLYLMLRYIPAPHTVYAGYKKVKPGHYLMCSPHQGIREYAYFSWDPHSSEFPVNQENFGNVVQYVENKLIQSLDERLMSDVPIGFFLSGGVDSSLAAALTRKHLGKSIHTFTIGFEGDPKSEHPISEQTAQIIGSHHKAEIFKPDQISRISRELITNMDEPNGDRSCVPTYLLCKHARSEVTVAIGGDGGDELFGGYGRYPNLDQFIGDDIMPQASDALKWYITHRLPVFPPKLTEEIFKGVEHNIQNTLDDMAVPLYSPRRPEMDIRHIDFRSYLPGAVLSKVDQMSMQVSLEVRTPFFSREILEISRRLPKAFLYNNGVKKIILREICRRAGLPHVAKLEKKGFGMPQEFMALNRDDLHARAKHAMAVIEKTITFPLNFNLWKQNTLLNINALWATIVLGEWLECKL